MASLQLANIPDDLLKRLELAAAAHRLNLREEVVDRLASSFGPPRIGPRRSPDELRDLASQIRGEGNIVGLTPEFIRMAREYGRE